jgi:predicted enzyme related to lactoylglutathione lyase
MNASAKHHTINYIEFSAEDVARAKQFYSTVFGWTFEDYGPDYASFNAADAGVHGGFRKSTPGEPFGSAAPLVVLYSTDLKATEAAIVAAGGAIAVPTFEFPGGRRFHFTDGAGNTLAVWSE